VKRFINFFVIVSCPECNKHYKLNSDRVKYVTIPNTNVLGVQLSCSDCKTHWWEQKKDLVSDKEVQPENSEVKLYQSQKYYDLTDISGLIVKNTRADRNFKTDFPQQPVNEFNNQKSRFSKNKNVGKSSKKYFFITFVFFLLLLLIGAGVLFIENKNQDNKKQNDLTEYNNDNSKEQNQNKDIEVNNITYEVKQSQDLRQVIVIGDIINPNNFDVKVPQIEVIVRGKCDPKDESDGIIDRWNYEWKRQKLTSQEKITFKTSRKIDFNFDITNVEIEVK
jgi:hypothetical protein